METTESVSIAPVSEFWKSAYKPPETAPANESNAETAEGELERATDETQIDQAQSQEQIDPNLLTIQKVIGTELFDNDPEVATLDRSHGIREFYLSVASACDAKKTRLASQPNQPNQPSDPGPRLPPGGSNAPHVAENAHEYWERAFEKK